MGYEAVFFARIHYQDFLQRQANQSLEMIWQPDGQAQIFAHVLSNHYASPPGLDFQARNKVPIVNDRKSEYYNAEGNAYQLIRYLNGLKGKYKDTGHLMVLFGDDFQYENGLFAFYNLDTLIEAVNEL